MSPAPRSLLTRRPTYLRAVVGLGAAALVLAGCGTQVAPTPVATGTGIPSLDEPVSSDPGVATNTTTPTIGADPTIALPPDGGLPQPSSSFDLRAKQVASEWLARGLVKAWLRGLVPLEALTRDPDFSPQPELKAAWGNGRVRTVGTLPALERAGGGVTVGDEKIPVAIVSAEQALRAATPQNSQDCATGADAVACGWVEVTKATLTTTTLQTNRGEATVPAWAFTIRGLKDTLVQVAVSPSDFDPPPSAAETIPGGQGGKVRGLVASQALLGVDGTTVSYTVGVGACDRNVLPRVYETKDLVIVGATVETSLNAVCTDQLLIQPVQVRVGSPLGDRAVVDALTGAPVLASSIPR